MTKWGARLDLEGARKMMLKDVTNVQSQLEDSTSTLQEIKWDSAVIDVLGDCPSFTITMEFLAAQLAEKKRTKSRSSSTKSR